MHHILFIQCELIVVWWRHMASKLLVSIGTGIGLPPNRHQAITSSSSSSLYREPIIYLDNDDFKPPTHTLPTKTYGVTTLVPMLDKYPLFADSGRERHPFFNRNRRYWGPIKRPFLKQNAILSSLYKIKYSFVKAGMIVTNIFLGTSYFCLCLIWNEYLNTRPRSNVWKPK